MKKVLLLIAFLSFQFLGKTQGLQQLTFGTPNSLEVLTWNLEHFAKSGQTTIDSTALVIKSLNADIIAFQEIDTDADFSTLINSLSGWDGFYDGRASLALAYIYNADVIDFKSSYQIYASSSYSRPFPRRPFVMEFKFMNEEYILINNHFKCCGDGSIDLNDDYDEETRRLEATDLLKLYIDNNLSNKKVIVVGDLNDVLTDSPSDNVFQNIIEDTIQYVFADMQVAQAGNAGWSYPNWPSHIDHIFITNELFADFKKDSSECKTIKVDKAMNGGFSAYDSKISDHLPVGLKLHVKVPDTTNNDTTTIDTTLSINQIIKPQLKVYPNPSAKTINVYVGDMHLSGVLNLYSIKCQLVLSEIIEQAANYYRFDVSRLNKGIYELKLQSESKTTISKKIVIQ